jgi:hypothetical protein
MHGKWMVSMDIFKFQVTTPHHIATDDGELRIREPRTVMYLF